MTDVEYLRLGPERAGEVLTVQRAAFVAEARVYGTAEIPPLTETLDRVHELPMSLEGGAAEPTTFDLGNSTPVYVSRNYGDKHRVLQILVNLLRNAKHACQSTNRTDKCISVRVGRRSTGVEIAVSDNGIGIPPENLTRIFSHGFTTKKNGHGFGLHSGALAAKELGGALRVESSGTGHGATFVLELPFESQENSHGQ